MKHLLALIWGLFVLQANAVTASFNANVTQGCAPLVVQFTNTSSGAVSYQWDFDDFLFSTLANPSHTFYQGGRQYEVWLWAYDGLGGVDSFMVTIDVPGFRPYFNAPSVVCPGELIDLAVFGSNDPSNVASWDMGDGNQLLYVNPAQYAYADTGLFTIVMTVTGNNCGTVTDSATVHVRDDLIPPIHVHSYSNGNQICPGENFPFFYDETYAIHWDFGDGMSSSDPYPVHTYASTGNYVATITVTNECGISNSLDTLVSVVGNVVPNAAIFSSGTAACPGDAIHFFGPSGFGWTYNWNFDDGTTDAGQHVFHAFGTTGSHQIDLTVTNTCGNTATATINYNVTDTLTPSSVMNVFYSPSCPGDTVLFYASQGLAAYQWNFGDGSFSTAGFTKHAYTAAGAYLATLTVTNGCGNSQSYARSIVIDSMMVPNITVTTNQSGFCPGDAVAFSTHANQPLQNFQWDFGDGFTSNIANPLHTYADTGTYQVQLIAENRCGIADTVHLSIVSDSLAAPFVDFDLTGGFSTCPGTPFAFINLSSDTTDVLWEFGDSTTSTLANPVHTYQSNGNYLVLLTVTNGCGQSATVSRLVQQTASALPQADMNLEDGAIFCAQTSFAANNVVANVDSVFWSLSNGFTSTDDDLMLTLDTGSYLLVLTTFNYCGMAQDSVQLSVIPAPQVPLVSCYMTADSLYLQWGAQSNTDQLMVSLDSGATFMSLPFGDLSASFALSTDSLTFYTYALSADGCASGLQNMSCYLTTTENLNLKAANGYYYTEGQRLNAILPQLRPGSYELRLTDVAGRTVAVKQVHHQHGTLKQGFDMSSNGKGIYFIEVEGNGLRATIKAMY